MENENAPAKVEEPKPKQKKKKKGKVKKVFEMHEKGASNKEISEKMNISERVVASYVWRMKNPEKYAELLKRYFAKRKQKQESEKKEA